METNEWLADYFRAQRAAQESVPLDAVARIIGDLRAALLADKQVFVFGNGGSAANLSHFATDLGKGASDKLGRRFRVMSLNENVAWMTAIANDYEYADVFVRQLQNFARPGDLVLSVSVSGNSPNCVRAFEWAGKNGLKKIAIVGARGGCMAELADTAIVINDTHYGRVEDVQMNILHTLCYAFMEHPEWGK
jgi:D-sedoheptulose 7-phosphate isomerase